MWSTVEFFSQYPGPGYQREAAIVREVLRGNVPSWCTQKAFVEKTLSYNNRETSLVAPDYLAIGTDTDFCRVPLTPYAAQYIASQMGWQFPTPHAVDCIWSIASHKLDPKPQNWYLHEESMRSSHNYILFNQIIGVSPRQFPESGGILAGHKKDVVSVESMLQKRPHHVAIYGWQYKEKGQNIQPLTLVHDWHYEDYSHGIRFIISKDGMLAGRCSLDRPSEEFVRLVES